MKKLKKVQSVQIPEIDSILERTPQENKNFVSKTLDIVDQISLILKENGVTQKALAEKLNKTEPEISKWLCGTHNFTIRTITLIETALDQEIIVTPHKVKSNIFHYASQIYHASINEKRTQISDPKKINTQTTKESKYDLAA